MTDHRFTFLSRRTSYFTIVAALLVNQLLGWLILRRHSAGFSALYVDPGSGILIWQVLAAAGAGFVFNIRRRVVRFVKLLQREKN
jgi:hypothetical protein